MNLCIEKYNDVTVVVLPGESLDAANSKEFKNDMGLLLEENKKLVVDMSEMRFVDSSGCGALLSCLRQLNADGGDLKLCSVSKPVRALFELIRMHRIFDIYNTREEALTAFEG